MKRFLNCRKALSTVVTTLIILVVSVLLATVVTYYAVNVTTTRVQQENLYLSKVHLWVDTEVSPTVAQGSICIVNTGGRDIVLDKVTVRSQECPWTNIYYWTTNNVTVSQDLVYTRNINASSGSWVAITIEGTSRNFTQASSDITLKSGYTMVIYIKDPDSISFNDIGTSASITIHTANAMWSQECNVEAVAQQ